MKISFDNSITQDLDEASQREWLETNGLGGWASSIISGAHTRRYHGLLVAATHPPVGRMVLLSKLDEAIVVGDSRFELSANRYPGTVHPRGFGHLMSFEKELFPVFEYEAGGVRLRKTIVAVHGENTTLVLYEVVASPSPVTLELQPFMAPRDRLRRASNVSRGMTEASRLMQVWTASMSDAPLDVRACRFTLLIRPAQNSSDDGITDCG